MCKGDASMNDNIPLPLYYKVKEDLKKKVEDNFYIIGESLPSEKGLMDIYNVSRTTIRQAVDLLVNEGFLERRRGLGTFAAIPKVNMLELEQLRSFSDSIRRQGYSPKTVVMSIKKNISSKKVQDVFGKTQEEFFEIERLRFVDNKPAVYVMTYVPCALAQNLDKENLQENSLFLTLELKYNIELAYAEKKLKAINVSKQDAKILNIQENSAIQLVETISYDNKSQPVEFSISKDRGDATEFCVRLQYKKN